MRQELHMIVIHERECKSRLKFLQWTFLPNVFLNNSTSFSSISLDNVKGNCAYLLNVA